MEGFSCDNNEKRGECFLEGMERVVETHRDILKAYCIFCTRLCRKHKEE